MIQPYQEDLVFLQEELTHFVYVTRVFEQECNEQHTQEFRGICADIKGAIQAVEKRQATAISEWAELTPSNRRAVLLPLIGALEETIKIAKGKGCSEFALYLEEYLCGYFMDLQNFKE